MRGFGFVFFSHSRKKETEILYIFFGNHTANVVLLAERVMQQQQAEVA